MVYVIVKIARRFARFIYSEEWDCDAVRVVGIRITGRWCCEYDYRLQVIWWAWSRVAR